MVPNHPYAVHLHSWRVVWGVLALLAIWLTAPRTAGASCGDYLAHIQNPFVADRMAAESQESPVPMRPCQGPSCRRSDAPIPMPTPAPVRLLGERWAMVLDFDVTPLLSVTFFSRETGEIVPTAHPSRLERPPKAI